jgi:hypothetical protein
MRRASPATAAAFFASLALFASSLVLGYGIASRWLGEAAVLGSTLGWILAGRRRASLCLSISVVTAAAGILLGASAPLMILGATASLGLWDLARARAGAKSPERYSRAYERLRLRSLAIALACGLVLALIALSARVTIRFPLMAAMAIAVFVCLDLLRRFLSGRQG